MRHCCRYQVLSNSYTMGCPPVRGDNPRALAMIKIETAPRFSFRGHCLYLPPKIHAHSCQPFHLFTRLACSRVVYWYFQELSLPLSPHDVIPGSPPTITEAPPLDRSLTAERSDEVSTWPFNPFNAFAE